MPDDKAFVTGRHKRVDTPERGPLRLRAKIDTGDRTSANGSAVFSES